MSYQVLARKWRPRSFPEMVGQEHVLRALINALDNDRLHHAFLFTGTRGVGKTTVARILAKSLNCERGVSSQPCGECGACREIDEGRFIDLIEVDAASRTKVEDTRELLENVQYAPSRGRYKVYLVDEVHMLSNHSFNALLKTLEEPPPHVKFLLATTDPQRLPVTILSRCLQFNLKRLPLDLIRGHLQRLVEAEAVQAEEGALTELARAADGSMRDALSLLDQAIAYGGGALPAQEVRAMLGTIDRDRVFVLLAALAAGDGERLLGEAGALAELSPDYAGVLAECASVLQRVALMQQVPQAVDDSLGDRSALEELAALFDPEDVQLYYQIAIAGRRDLPLAPDPRTGFDMALLRMLAFRPAASEGGPSVAGPGPGARRSSGARSPTSAFASASPAPSPAEAPTVRSAGGQPQQEPPEPAPPPGTEPAPEPPPPPEPERPETAGPLPVAGAAGAAHEWAELVGQLKLGGILQQLAAHCALESREGDHFRLVVEPNFGNLLSRQREENLREALSNHLGREVQLSVRSGSAEATPDQLRREAQARRQKGAEQAIAEDPAFNGMLERFDGQLVAGSVRPNDG